MEQHQHAPRASEERWSYAKFVTENPIAARTLESVLQYSGFFAPASFADRDLSIESGYALSSLAALAHDRILLDGQGSLGQGRNDRGAGNFGNAEGGLSPDAPKRRGERSCSVAVFAERMRVALAMIAHVQVVVEKLAGQHGGARRRRQAITYLETLKAISRLLLLACTREMVMGGGAYVAGGKRRTPRRQHQNKSGGSRPWREVDLRRVRSGSPQSSEFAATNTNANYPPPPSPRAPEVYTGKRSGVRLVVPPRASVIWSGRGRSNRPIGVGRSAITSSFSSSSSLRDGDGDDYCSSSSSCSQRSPGDRDFCNNCRARDIGSSSRVPLHEYGGQEIVASISSSETANGEIPYVAEEWRHRRREQGGGGRTGDAFASYAGASGGPSQAWLMAGEVIHILRPLVYSYSCGSAGERSWRPWLTSLAMDAAAFACTARAGGGGAMSLLIPIGAAGSGGVDGSGADNGVPVLPCLDEEQAAELRRRKLLWFLYLMRSPAFEVLAEPVSRGAAGVFEGVPLLGGMANYALNMLLYVQRHHFYTSAS
eukprot:g9825.t1